VIAVAFHSYGPALPWVNMLIRAKEQIEEGDVVVRNIVIAIIEV
jgi:hypothetical protein